jgi:iron complex transport system ATP-binding protein
VLLEATDLRFHYRPPPASSAADLSRQSDRWVVDGVSMAVPHGALVGVLGPNGSGKTTLLKLLAGALKPSAGRVTLDGESVSAVPKRHLARRLAVVPQETNLAFDYSVLEVVLMGRYPRLGAFEIEGPADVAAALGALATTGTEDLATRPFRTLSGGEKQRVVIASALAQLDDAEDANHTASLLLLDEPTASLDLKYQLEIAALVRRLGPERSITVVLSTHDLRLAASVCRSLVLLRDGRVLAEGPPAVVLTPARIAELYDIHLEQAGLVLQ